MGKVIQLCVMMFLQFFVWGAWYVTAPNYLSTINFEAADFGWTYAVGPIAGMISPFFVGMIADRFFSAQRVLAVLHIAGGAIMLGATRLMGSTTDPSVLNGLFFGYMLTYYPTLALSNTLAMKHMTNPEKEFPIVRVFGTIGWIAAGWVLTLMSYEKTIDMFYLTGGAAILLGVYSITLPDTPPEAKGKVTARELLGLDALVLLKDWSYLIFMVASTLICIPLAFYYQIASRVVEMTDAPIASTMAYGQVSEIIFMLIMSIMFARLGVKYMLGIGMACWVARYALFAFGAPTQNFNMILIGILLHGICYDFFFVTGQIYTDQVAPKNIRGQAQGLLVLFTLGLGMFIGAQVAGNIEGMYTPEEAKNHAKQVKSIGEEIKTITDKAGDEPDEATKEKLKSLEAAKKKARLSELKAIDWKSLWGFPAIFAGAVLVLFMLLFKGPPVGEAKGKPAG